MAVILSSPAFVCVEHLEENKDDDDDSECDEDDISESVTQVIGFG